jgi:hypothetical protein
VAEPADAGLELRLVDLDQSLKVVLDEPVER